MNRILLTLCFISCLILSSCASDPELTGGNEGGELSSLHINLLLSGSGSTRAVEADGEGNEEHPSEPLVTDALVLLFEPDDAGTLSEQSKLSFLIKAENPVEITESKYSLDFRVEIDPANVAPQLVAVILANGCARYDEINALDEPTYQDIREAVTMEYGSREEEIAASTAGEYFTLWGISTHNVDTSLLTQTLKVNILRDLAKTTVLLDSDLIETTGHALTGVMVYNRFDMFSLLPEIGSGNSPVLPSIPEDASKTEQPAIAGVSEDGAFASIFHPEQDILMGSLTKDPDDDSKFSRPAMIVGVDWKGTGKTYYYRVDYKEDGVLIDVKRNHHYQVNITDIKGPGAETPEKAYHTLSASVEVTVTPWTDVDNDVEIDGDNWIAMQRTVILDAKEGSTAELSFSTNVEVGLWEMAWGESGAEWDSLTFSDDDEVLSEDGAFSVKKGETLIFTANKSLPEEMDRQSKQLYIKVTPRLRLVINVVQSAPTSSGNMTNWGDQNIFGEI